MVRIVVEIDDGNMTNEHDPTDDTTTTQGATTTMEPDGSTGDVPPGSPPPGSPPHGSPRPPAGPPPRMRRSSPNGLTRDPYSALGGVASGIAHRYGLSTALVRLVFTVVLFVTFFFALPIYLAAWVIIPRAVVWPPEAVRLPGQKFSSRDLGMIALIGGLIAFLMFGVDGVGSVLVALAFVTAGVALLLQHDRNPAPPAPDAVVASYAAAPSTTPVGEPVPPRSAKRKWFLGLLIGGVVLFVASVVAVPIALIARGDLDDVDFETGTIDFRFDDDLALVDLAPTDVDGLPRSIDAEGGAVSIDLSGIAVSEFAALDEAARLDIELGAGDVDIVLPEGLEFSIDADADRGDIDIDLGEVSASIDRTSRGEDVTVVNEDADLDLRIDVGNGDISIETDR